MTTPSQTDALAADPPGLVAAAPWAPALAVAILGAALILITAFAPVPVLHNAAHDSRHSFAVPCH